MSKDNDEIEFDFSKINKSLNKGFKSTTKFLKTNKYVIPVILIFIAIFLSTYFRMYPSHLPMTDKWAEDSVINQIKSEISQQVSRDYPNLPDSQKQTMIQREVNKYIDKNKDRIELQIGQYSQQFRSRFQDDNNNTYLLAIDPYLWYGYAKNILDCGHQGCHLMENESGEKEYSTLRNGRNIHIPSTSGEARMSVGLYYVMNLFGETSLMRAMFFIPIIFVGIAIIPAFLLGKRLGGNVGGFISAMIIALNSALLSRTPGGFTDNDGAIIMFPLLIIWCLVGYMEAKTLTKKILFAVGGALSFYLMSFIWPTQHIFLAILCTVIMYIGIIALIRLLKTKKFIEIYKVVKEYSLKPFIFILTSALTLTISVRSTYVIDFFNRIIQFVYSQEAAIVGTIWPNVKTTVAELNVKPLSELVNTLGGNFLVFLALIGLVMLFVAKDKNKRQHLVFSCAIFVWTVATVFSFTRGTRFNILVLPSFAVCLGTTVGVLYRFASKWLSKEMNIDLASSKGIFSVLILLFFILPITPDGSIIASAHNVASNQIPSYNDSLDETLDMIKSDASPDIGYITTWWDFGHWFVAKGISVTFDGGDQKRRIHWVGKSLLTDDEELSVSIIRMLNCGQENSFNLLEEYTNDSLKAVDLTYETIVEDKETARAILEEENISEEVIDEFLNYTHCDDDVLFPQYFITSEDMVGKAGVWGHFGSWNFTKAEIWNKVRKTDFDEGVNILRDEYNVSEDDAPGMYYEIQRRDAGKWVADTPGYLSDEARCEEQGNLMRCENGVEINLTSMKTYLYTEEGKIPANSISFIDPEDTEFKVIEFDGETVPYSVLLLPNMKTMIVHPDQAGSMFTRLFFYEGHSLKHFKPFADKTQVTGQRILTWKVDWDSDKPLEAFTPPEIENE